MEYLDTAALLAQIAENQSKTFYCTRSEVELTKRRLQEAGIPVRTQLGNSPTTISSWSVCLRPGNDGVRIRIKVVPDNPELLDILRQLLGPERTPQDAYTGASQGVTFTMLMLKSSTSRRLSPPQAWST